MKFPITGILILPFMFSSCGNEPEKSVPESVIPQETIPKAQRFISKDSIERTPYIEQVTHVIFGVYCGECSGECATMYRYNMDGNANTLQVDHTDSFFKQPRKVNCNTPVNDGAKIRMAGEVMDHIPLELLKATEDKRYGCPDCTDGCGIYFELGTGKQVYHFYLDPIDRQLDPEIRDFTQFLREMTYRLKK